MCCLDVGHEDKDRGVGWGMGVCVGWVGVCSYLMSVTNVLPR